ncbi:hypothetical protein PVAP13_8NG182105 [Panicum virgatum]|uniref:Uncharacterized protein n=1 Tax=Panicum virgatum TaxID=38727 RepID=A0A8T0P8E6_PANVG|nr:hypothetical protein PVAP13_8NG182105 [Panicum virgatum]
MRRRASLAAAPHSPTPPRSLCRRMACRSPLHHLGTMSVHRPPRPLHHGGAATPCRTAAPAGRRGCGAQRWSKAALQPPRIPLQPPPVLPSTLFLPARRQQAYCLLIARTDADVNACTQASPPRGLLTTRVTASSPSSRTAVGAHQRRQPERPRVPAQPAGSCRQPAPFAARGRRSTKGGDRSGHEDGRSGRRAAGGAPPAPDRGAPPPAWRASAGPRNPTAALFAGARLPAPHSGDGEEERGEGGGSAAKAQRPPPGGDLPSGYYVSDRLPHSGPDWLLPRWHRISEAGSHDPS